MIVRGIGASDGIVIGKVYKFENIECKFEDYYTGVESDEVEKLQNAMKIVSSNIEKLKSIAGEKMGSEHAAIFDAHYEMLWDPTLKEEVIKLIGQSKYTAAKAYKEVTGNYIEMFEAMDDAYMRERAADVKDISHQMIMAINGVEGKSLEDIREAVVVVAEDLTPSDTARLNKEFVKGFVTNIGGRTSHSAIMARTLEIPAVVGTQIIMDSVSDGDKIIIDGLNGLVITSPSEDELSRYSLEKASHEKLVSERLKLVDSNSETKDGFRVELAANIGSPKDLDGVKKNGAEGIGLYRTEFLYMDSVSMPDEEVQFEAYKEVLEGMAPKGVVIRTLDIGGDKKLPYLQMPEEMNPFLGHRAIRLCLEEKELFDTQIRALLRASVFGNLKIMFPMIATVEEFLLAKERVMNIKSSLVEEGVNVSDSIEIGIMVEIPSTAVMAKQFARVVDFFSIGTNDLIQYTFAADRMNEKVSYLYQPYHPALLWLIASVIKASHEEGKWTGMCGEMAGDPLAIPLLIGLGLDEFSMSASSVLKARELISKISVESARQLVMEALEMSSNSEVESLVKAYLEEVLNEDV